VGISHPVHHDGGDCQVLSGVALIATSPGKPNRYHETITWAYLLLLDERIQTSGPMTWKELWPPTLICSQGKKNRKEYYGPETLDSWVARRVFFRLIDFEPVPELSFRLPGC
jgi:hypothetical protein